MRFSDALLIEGTSKILVLCYGVFPVNNYGSAYEIITRSAGVEGWKIYKFLDDGWENGLVLIEAYLECEEDIFAAMRKLTSKMFEVGSCKAVSFMYDGAFVSYDDIFSKQIASQTYAFSFSKEGLVINLDVDFLSRNEWEAALTYARTKLKEI